MFFLMMSVTIHAQFINNGATVTIQFGATLRIETDFINNSGTVTNNGVLEVKEDFTNAAAATFTSAVGSTVKFIGDTPSTVTSNGDAFHHVSMEKTAENITLADAMSVVGTLTFTNDNNKVILGANNLTIQDGGSIASADANEYVVTDGAGKLIKNNLNTTAFTFPVGFNQTTYNPITISENGTPDDIGVRVLENIYLNGVSGTQISSEAVDATWSVSELTSGGSNLNLDLQWSASDELPLFTRNDCGVSKYIGPTYDLALSGLGAALGSDPYTRTRTGVTPGNFVVGDDSVLDYVAVSPKAFLSPYSASSGLMSDAYRSNNVLPTTEPYTGYTNFTYVGRRSGETVNSSVFAVTGNDAIVDWVFIQVRNTVSPYAVIATKSAFIQRDGDIVDIDGGPVKFLGVPTGTYKVAIRHRNHMGIMTNSNKSLSSATIPLDFSNSASPEPTLGGTSKQILVSGTFPAYIMRGGDGNVSGSITASDNNLIWLPSNGQIITNSTYFTHGKADFNMNRVVQASDSNLTWLPSNGNLQGFNNN